MSFLSRLSAVCCLLLMGHLGQGLVMAQPAGNPAIDVESAARDYRIEIYGSYRTDRAEYDLRRKQGESLMKSWIDRGRLPSEALILQQWFQSARQNSAAQKPLPPLPHWLQPNTTDSLLPQRNPFDDTPAPIRVVEPTLSASLVARQRQTSRPSWSAVTWSIMQPVLGMSGPETAVPRFVETNQVALINLASRWSRAASPIGRTSFVKQSSKSVAPLALPALVIAKVEQPVTVNKPLLPDNANTAAPTDRLKAELNVAELTARINGFQRGIKALQIDLYSEEPFTLDRAEQLLSIVQDLQAARQALILYQALAPAELQTELQALVKPNELLAALRQRVIQAEQATASLPDPETRGQQSAAWRRVLEQLDAAVGR